MEYKSELIDFEKEDMESKKRMLGSDKVTIQFSKIMNDDYFPEDLKEASAEEIMRAIRDLQTENKKLLLIIEQAEKALNDIADSKYLTIEAARKISDLALQAIRK